MKSSGNERVCAVGIQLSSIILKLTRFFSGHFRGPKKMRGLEHFCAGQKLARNNETRTQKRAGKKYRERREYIRRIQRNK